MRDPFEAEDLFIPYIHGDPPPSAIDMQALQKGINRVLKQETKLLALTLDGRDGVDLREVRGHFYRGYARPRMWEQYGEGHMGVCLLYDERLVPEVVGTLRTRGRIFQGRVTYTATAYTGLHESPLDYRKVQSGALTLEQLLASALDTIPQQLFFAKLDDWAAEQEYRIALHSDATDYEFVGVHGLLKGVVIGHRFPESELYPLIPMCAERAAVLARLEWESGFPQLRVIYNPTAPFAFSADHPQTGHLVRVWQDAVEAIHPSHEEWEATRVTETPVGIPVGPPEAYRSRFL